MVGRPPAALLRSNQGMRWRCRCLMALPAFIVRKNVDGQFTFVNRRYAAMLGKTVEEVLGKTDHDLYASAVADRYRAEDQRVMASGEMLDVVERAEQEGPIKYYAMRKSPYRDDDGNVLGVQSVFWDVTERKMAEQALQEERDRLQDDP